MTTVAALREWLDELRGTDRVGIADDGLCLMARDQRGREIAWLEIGADTQEEKG